MKIKIPILLLLVISPFIFPFAQTDPVPLVIYLVRHAEPEFPPYKDDPPNPPLNGAGHSRAQQLAQVLSKAKIDGIYTTDFRRTRQTTHPLAELIDKSPRLYDHTKLEELAVELKRRQGQYVVVGHSNTTPRVVELLGGAPGEPIDNMKEFDRLYIVLIHEGKRVTTLQHRYGTPSER